jgi:hypothetical protein
MGILDSFLHLFGFLDCRLEVAAKTVRLILLIILSILNLQRRAYLKEFLILDDHLEVFLFY